jgi:hypothetical protein
MADTKNVATLGPYILRVQAGALFLANEIAQKIENMYPLEEGTLRTAVGPAAYVPLKDPPSGAAGVTTFGTKGDRPFSAMRTQAEITSGLVAGAPDGREIDNTVPVYGKHQHGIYHALLKGGERDVLLLHTGPELWEFRGWSGNWRQLLSNPASPHGLQAELPDDSATRFPTQFESTGNGIVVVPQGGRAYFYDGDKMVALGFSEVPSAPMPRGPQDSSGSVETDNDEDNDATNLRNATGKGVNDTGYAHDGTFFVDTDKLEAGMTYGFGTGNLGTTSGVSGSISSLDESTFSALSSNSGWLEAGEWKCRVQLVDEYGNLSALSSPSEVVRISRQPANAKKKSSGLPKTSALDIRRKFNPDFLMKQIAWAGVPTGPDHCVGRILYRTKDLLNSGDTNYYEITPNAVPTATAFATMPDNVTTIYPDNTSDAALAVPPIEVAPVPQFSLCRMAFGRLWIANIPGAPGLLRPSLPGRWGTFPVGLELFPDPKGGEITGLWRTDQGLLVFTSDSVFLVAPSDDGLRFVAAPISSGVGCAAPNSIQTLPDGRVIWLGSDGFYTYDGASVAPVAETLRKFFRKVTTSRLPQACSLQDARTREYRCWVSINGSVENNACLVYDGVGWRTRTDTIARDACVTQDHRGYPLIAGHVAGDTDFTYGGVYLLDHSGNRQDTTGLQEEVDSREAIIETAWMEGTKSKDKKTARVAYLWLRETENADISIEVLRDWRNEITETVTLQRYSTADPPTFYGSTLGATGAKFSDRRPFWTRAEVYLPSAGTFKFRIRGKGFWEFVAITIDEVPRGYGGAQIPP